MLISLLTKPSGCRGDPSDEFKFATFFPALLQPAVDKLAGLCSQIFRVGLQQPAAARADSGSSYTLNSAPLPGSDSAEAARRRSAMLNWISILMALGAEHDWKATKTAFLESSCLWYMITGAKVLLPNAQ